MDMLTVCARTGRAPMEGCQGWSGQEPVQVPNSYYYRQLVASGEIEETATATEIPDEAMRQAPTGKRVRSVNSFPTLDPSLSSNALDTLSDEAAP
jgi:hypothetical protein